MFSWSFLSVSFLFSFFPRVIADLQAEATRNNKPFRTPIHQKSNNCFLFFKRKEDINPELVGRPIIDISVGNCQVKSIMIPFLKMWGGVIIRVHSGAQAKRENASAYLNGLDKSFKPYPRIPKAEHSCRGLCLCLAKDKKRNGEKTEEFYRLLLL